MVVIMEGTHNVPKMSIGNNVVTCAKRNATKMVIVPQHAKPDANVTRVFSDRTVFVSRDAQQRTHALKTSTGRSVVMNAKKNVTTRDIVLQPVKQDVNATRASSDKAVFASRDAPQHIHARKTSIGRNVVMNAKKNATKMVIAPRHVKNAANATRDFSDRAVFANKVAQQHTHATKMNIGRNAVMNAKKSATRTVIAPQHVKHAVNVIRDFSDRVVFANKVVQQHIHALKMNIGKNVAMNAKKNAIKMVIVPQHVKQDANVTKVTSDRVVYVSKVAQQHTHAPKMSIGRNVVMNAKKSVIKTAIVLQHVKIDANVTKVTSDRGAYVS